MKQRKSIEERVAGFKQFYAGTNSKPLVGFFVGSEYPIKRYPTAQLLPESRDLQPADFAPAAYAADELRLCHAHESAGGDFVHSGSAYWGVPWMEALIGCSIRANQATGSLYAEPPRARGESPDAAAIAIPPFDPESAWARLAGQMIDGLVAAAGGAASGLSFPLGTTRMRGVADLLFAVMGAEAGIGAMVDGDPIMHRLAAAITDVYIDFADFQLRHIPSFHGGVGSFYYDMWAPAGTVWHQEDSCSLISPDLYAEYIAPYDRRIFAACRSNIVHFHSTGGYAPIDEILALQPAAVELHIDSGGPSAEDLYQRHLSILERSPLLIWGALSKADIDWVFAKLPAAGLAVNIAVESEQQASTIGDYLEHR